MRQRLAALFLLALAAALSAALAGAPQAASAEPGPPLEGVFADNFNLAEEPLPAPQEPFRRGDGSAVSLADFTGRVVLLNFWATWCGPCVREMPSLDRLQAALGPEGLEVVAVSEDRKQALAEAFLVEHRLDHLALYMDQRGKVAQAFGLRGLPTTYLIDRQGRLVGGLQGPAEWDDEEAKALIRWYLKQPAALEQPVETSG